MILQIFSIRLIIFIIIEHGNIVAIIASFYNSKPHWFFKKITLKTAE